MSHWSLPPEVRLETDTSPARWLAESLPKHPWATVGAVVPEGFDAYARILHPAHRRTEGEWEPVSWAQVAAETGRALHPLAQFALVANLEDHLNGQPRWGSRPAEGDLPTEFVAPLLHTLAEFTTAPELCWFCIWYGWGQLQALSGYDESHPRVVTPGREYLLLRGELSALDALAAHHHVEGPSIWWPDDRAWCVATEVDLDSTYVGGTKQCIEHLAAHPALEVLPASLEDRVDFGADTINR